jgi:hypothetical protein
LLNPPKIFPWISTRARVGMAIGTSREFMSAAQTDDRWSAVLGPAEIL